MAIAFFLSSIFMIYAYAFFFGTVFIFNDVWNSVVSETYTAGHVLTCFFGLVMGMFTLGMAAPNIKAIAEGKAAAKSAFEIIDRVPEILVNDQNGKKLNDFKGAIEFKNVDFYYPSRPDQKILDNFSAVFEPGTTIAIVGPSGSGKSTII